MNKALLAISLVFILISCSSSDDITDDQIKEIFPDYPAISIFKSEYLEFFSDNPEQEIANTENHQGKYTATGDFDRDGHKEIAVTGLLSPEPKDGKYNCFFTILSKQHGQYQVEFFKPIYKKVGQGVQNLIVDYSSEEVLSIGFKYETSFMAIVGFQNGEYTIQVIM